MKIINKIISVAFCIVLLFPYTSFAADAIAPVPDITSVVEHELGWVNPLESAPSVSLAIQTPYYSSPLGVPFVNQRTQLNDLEKFVYDKLSALKPSDTTGTSLNISLGTGWTADQFYSISIQRICDAVYIDCPEIFWVNFRSLGATDGYYSSTGAALYRTLVVNCETNSTYYSDPAALYATMMGKVTSPEFSFNNRYEFVRNLHDYICALNVYPKTIIEDASARMFNPIGVLVDGGGVCQAYSETFKLFCDYYKIPCVCIIGLGNGGNHMWNAVQMDDGNWYLLDITWNDQDFSDGSSRIFNDFFLVGLSTYDIYFGKKMFSESHIMQNSNSYANALVFSYPPLSQSSYVDSYQNHITGFLATDNSSVSGKILYTSLFRNFDTVYFNGLTLTISSSQRKTGASFTAPSGASYSGETWTLALFGDVNGDGLCNASDTSIVTDKALSADRGNALADKLSDVNQDGVIDVFDVMNYELAASGNSDFSDIY